MSLHDSVPVSLWLIRWVAASILGGLGAVGAYMISWNAHDAGFKREVLTRLANQDRDLDAITRSIVIVPANTQKIINLERRVDRIEERQ